MVQERASATFKACYRIQVVYRKNPKVFESKICVGVRGRTCFDQEDREIRPWTFTQYDSLSSAFNFHIICILW